MNGVPITKMSGAGNDFIVLDEAGRGAVAGDWATWVRAVCRRGLSVGADGVLVVTPVGADRVRVEFFNPDGGTAFCGNGSRCAARYARLHGMTGDAMTLETAAGDVEATLEPGVVGGRVRLALPAPRDLGALVLELPEGRLAGRHIDAGSPHFVFGVDDVGAFPLASVGPLVRRHPAFGVRGTNFDIVAPVAAGVFRLRTWERGVEAETLACGSGAVATACALRIAGSAPPAAIIRLVTAASIELEVTIEGPVENPERASLTGDARVVFETRLGDEGVAP